MNTMINARAGASFDARDLKGHIRRSGRTYIVQGQWHCALGDHPKPNSLDVWIRKNCDPNNTDTTQADNGTIKQLVRTGLFREGKFKCPDSGNLCKGIEIVF